MIIAYLLIGCVIGAAAAVMALLGGAPIWLAVLCYSFGGSIGTLFAALVIHGLIELRSPLPDATPDPSPSR